MGNQLAPATKQGASLETQGELLNVVVKETLGGFNNAKQMRSTSSCCDRPVSANSMDMVCPAALLLLLMLLRKFVLQEEAAF